jgi:Lrp/AsnC family transcriptional regulator
MSLQHYDGARGAVDVTDRKILEILQRDASTTVAEIGRSVGLSAAPCWKRIQKLMAEGVIRKRVALLARDKLGLGVTVQVFMQAGDHAPEIVAAFIDKVCEMPEVIEFHRLAGEFDFLLRVVAVDVPHFDAVYRRLTSLMAMRRVSSFFELAQLKSETALPLGFSAELAGKPEAALPALA